MSSIDICDICRKKKNEKLKQSWTTMSLRRSSLEHLPGLESSYVSFDLCGTCAEPVLTKTIELIRKGK